MTVCMIGIPSPKALDSETLGLVLVEGVLQDHSHSPSTQSKAS